MATAVRKSQSKAAVAVATPAPVVAPSKPTVADRLVDVLVLIDREAAGKVDAQNLKWGKAIPLQGGGSVYINHGNADVRGTTGQVAAWVKAIPGSTARGPQGQYLRIPFTK